MTTDHTFDKIEAWLSGELPEAEAQAFEVEVAGNEALAKEVERHRRGREALDQLAAQARQQDIARWQESMDVIPPPPDGVPIKKNTNWLRFIAAYVTLPLLIALAGYWFWGQKDNLPLDPQQQEAIPPLLPKETAPVADNPPSLPDPKTTVPTNEPQTPKQSVETNADRLIAMAETNLSDFRSTLLNEYGGARRIDDIGDPGAGENAPFSDGLTAFRKAQLKTATALLLQIKAGNPYFSAAQEILASIYFSEKKYNKAAACYEAHAAENNNPNTDLRLLHFYLADYDNRKAAFWNKMNEMLDPNMPHKFSGDAQNLKAALLKMGISEK